MVRSVAATLLSMSRVWHTFQFRCCHGEITTSLPLLDTRTLGCANAMEYVTLSHASPKIADLDDLSPVCHSIYPRKPLPPQSIGKLTRPAPATLQAKIACPDGTPYEGQVITLELVAFDGYPFIAPRARLLERVSEAGRPSISKPDYVSLHIQDGFKGCC